MDKYAKIISHNQALTSKFNSVKFVQDVNNAKKQLQLKNLQANCMRFKKNVAPSPLQLLFGGVVDSQEWRSHYHLFHNIVEEKKIKGFEFKDMSSMLVPSKYHHYDTLGGAKNKSKKMTNALRHIAAVTASKSPKDIVLCV